MAIENNSKVQSALFSNETIFSMTEQTIQRDTLNPEGGEAARWLRALSRAFKRQFSMVVDQMYVTEAEAQQTRKSMLLARDHLLTALLVCLQKQANNEVVTDKDIEMTKFETTI